MWVSTFHVVGFFFFYCDNGYIIPFSPGDFCFIFSCQMPNVCGLCSHRAEHQGILIKLVIYEFRKDPYSVGNICVIPDRPTCWARLVLFKAPILAVPVSRWITAGSAVPTWLKRETQAFFFDLFKAKSLKMVSCHLRDCSVLCVIPIHKRQRNSIPKN